MLGYCSACTYISQLLTFISTKPGIGKLPNITISIFLVPKGTACEYFLNATSASPVLMSRYVTPGQSLQEEALSMCTLPVLVSLWA